MKIILLAIFLSLFVYVECLPKNTTTTTKQKDIKLVYVGDENYPSPFSKKEGQAETFYVCGGTRKCKGSTSDKRLAKIQQGLNKMRKIDKWGTYTYDGIYFQAKNWNAWNSPHDCWNHYPDQLEGDAVVRGYLASYVEWCVGVAKCSTQYWVNGC